MALHYRFFKGTITAAIKETKGKIKSQHNFFLRTTITTLRNTAFQS